jgi:hypothetical protein
MRSMCVHGGFGAEENKPRRSFKIARSLRTTFSQ